MSRRRYPVPPRERYMTSMTCTTAYAFGSAFSCSDSPDYREPAQHAQCAYCRTRYYLSIGDRMNCTQCGAPL